MDERTPWLRQRQPVQRGWFVGMACLGAAEIVPWHALGGALIVAFFVMVWRYRG